MTVITNVRLVVCRILFRYTFTPFGSEDIIKTIKGTVENNVISCSWNPLYGSALTRLYFQ